MTTLLDRLAHARVLARMRESQAGAAGRSSPPPVEPTPRSTDAAQSTRIRGSGFVRTSTAWSLRTPSARRARAFVPDPSEPTRPRLLGGALERLPLPDPAQLAAALERLGARSGARPVFLDSETTGLHGGGTMPFVLGIAYLDERALWTEQWVLEQIGGEATMLDDLLGRLDQLGPAPLVSFNGSSFDLPLLRTRAKRHGLDEGPLQADHLDLLHHARRLWRDRGDDCRLATLERDQLDVHRRDDIASRDIPEIFWRWLDSPGDAVAERRLRAVVDHNAADLVTLPALAVRMHALIEAPTDLPLALRAASLLERVGDLERARSLLSEWLLESTPPGSSSLLRAVRMQLAELERRAGDRHRAAEHWQILWQEDPGDPEVCERLAKHLEHHVGDLERALEVARGSASPCMHRIARLERKLGAAQPQSPAAAESVEPDRATESSSATDASERPASPPAVSEPTTPEFVVEASPSPAPIVERAPEIRPAWACSVALAFAPWKRPPDVRPGSAASGRGPEPIPEPLEIELEPSQPIPHQPTPNLPDRGRPLRRHEQPLLREHDDPTGNEPRLRYTLFTPRRIPA